MADPARSSRPRLHPTLLGLGVWTAIALAFVTSSYAMYAIKGEPQALWKIFFWGAAEWSVRAQLAFLAAR